ncbi:dihydrolipoamide acetyltransferase component of pyruvate dehydrogenase complex [Vulcanimicrobium alpinum]|uniref:Dihydrolipoamide acetyltransferase component of pyruvate dehydrogenase complex n=1 Tax=Vulcanimicrobium alpinum TaxID=3016050 RepID=A0AAN1XW94_UNVUL|nr:dihydrolipoamide acetyltransferase family protein [Vulcanimicrobium alpinum]BDE05676.1 dihydrolipoamide acetyltransferase component of pyruvate dehydrogenase complex [Vulcanimicrobium alpinum]
MATTITMPQLGETVTEGTVAQWLKKPGDSVEKYEAFVEVSTDKVNAEVPAPVTGIIRELIAKEGETVPTGAPIAIIDEVVAPRQAQDDVSTPAASGSPSEQVAAPYATPTHSAEANRQGATDPVPGGNMGVPSASFNAPPSAASNGASALRQAQGDVRQAPGDAGVRTSPAVRRLAREHRVDLAHVRGTGDHGRITANDILAAAQAGPSAGVAATISADNPEFTAAAAPATAAPPRPASAKPTYGTAQPGELIPLTQARRIIAQRMVESKHTAPHAWTMVEVDVTNVWRWRAREKDAFERAYGVKLTLLPFFIRAVVESLAAFPLMNSSFTDEGIAVHRDVNVGIAIAAESNLVVPVIRHADQLSIKGIALAAGELIDKARRNKLGADDLAGGTFTVNNTGANGAILSAPILVPGQTGIVTTEAVVKRPVVRVDDSIAVRSMMNVCMSLDHRVVDGAVASGFLSDLKERLEAMGPTGSL